MKNILLYINIINELKEILILILKKKKLKKKKLRKILFYFIFDFDNLNKMLDIDQTLELMEIKIVENSYKDNRLEIDKHLVTLRFDH